MDEVFARGWAKFLFDPPLAAWAAHANAAALAAEAAPAANMLRCAGSWFVGVNALGNDGAGRLPGGPPLEGAAIDAARALAGASVSLDCAQASVCYPGYPRRGAEEGDAAFRYRRDRDAAHVDGLHRIMPGRRRRLLERHAFILGLPLNETTRGAAPFVIWEGAHEIMRAALGEALAAAAPGEWAEVDVTEAYQSARRRCFEDLRRVEIHAKPGEAYLVHRLALHGVGPWPPDVPGERRAIAYFRPEPDAPSSSDWWISAP